MSLHAKDDFERLFCWFKSITGLSQPGHPESLPISAVEASKSALKTGYLKKLGYVNPEWKQRYIVVTETKIYWFDEANSLQQNGELDKREILQVQRTAIQSSSAVFLITKERKYAFIANTDVELNEWEYRFKNPELLQKEAQIEEEKRLKEEERQRALAEEQRKLEEKLAFYKSFWVDPFRGGPIVKSWEFSGGVLLCREHDFEYNWLMTKDGMLLQSTNPKAGYLVFNLMTNGFWSFELMSQGAGPVKRPKHWMIYHFNPQTGVFNPSKEDTVSPSWIYRHDQGSLTAEGTPQQIFPYAYQKIEALGIPPPLLLFVALMETLRPQIADHITTLQTYRAVVAQSVSYGAPPVAPKPRNSMPQTTSHKQAQAAYLCNNCSFGNKKDNCVHCGKWCGGTKYPAKLCINCGFGNKKDNCAKCGKWCGSIKVPAVLCINCGFGTKANNCVECSKWVGVN